jgi:2-methylcitrate dehydratase PrpD
VTLLERLGAHAAGGYRQGLSGPLRATLRLHLADTVGAWIAAGATAEGRALRRFASAGGEDLPGRVALACALARSSEIDDIHLSSGTTPGAIVIPAAVTLAGALGSGGATLAEAIAVGYDLMTRLGAALNGPMILYRGIWPTYFAAPVAVAAVAARLLGLSGEKCAHALAVALAFASPAVGRQSGASMSRWFALGNAARSGVAAALAAQAGFTGDLGLLEGELFSGVYRLSLDAGALVDGLEQGGAAAQTSLKPWCAARQTMAAVQALREIIGEGVPLSEMDRLVVGVPLPYLKMIDHGVVPGERISCLTSVSYQMALFAFDPNANIDVGHVRDVLPRDIERFMARISVVPDDDLVRHFPQSWPALLAVETSRGRREKLVLHVPGDPERPFDEFQVAAKFWRLVAPRIGERSTEDLLRLGLAAFDGEGGARALLEAVERAVPALRPA